MSGFFVTYFSKSLQTFLIAKDKQPVHHDIYRKYKPRNPKMIRFLFPLLG